MTLNRSGAVPLIQANCVEGGLIHPLVPLFGGTIMLPWGKRERSKETGQAKPGTL